MGDMTAMPRRHRRAARVSVSLLATLLLFAWAHFPALGAEPGLIRLEVTIGKSQVLNLQEPFTRVSVTNPAIADVFVVTPNQILINGKAVGTTSLVAFYPTRTVFFDVVVQSDLALLKERLKQVAPRDEIQIHSAHDAIILEGNVSSERTIAGVVEVASVFAPKGKVISLLSLTDVKPQQVMLQVHVAEIARANLKELGFAARALGQTFQGAVFPGNPFSLALGTIGPVVANTVIGTSSPDVGFAGSTIFLSSANRDYAGVVRAMTDRGVLRTLAKPNLVTQSGKEAKFLSGGEFPYPVSQDNNTVTIEFKEFGVGLVFLPVVQDGENISLKIRPEVSSLDFSQGLVSSGFNIPVIRKNMTATTINLKDGESFAIAGLVNNEVRQAVAKIPILGDIPILGALFRSTRFQNKETELVFLVTAKLVKPDAPGAGVDARRLMDLREDEKKDFTLVPGIPGVGDIVTRPFGQSNLPAK